MKRRRLSLFLFLCLNKVKKRNTSGKLCDVTLFSRFFRLLLYNQGNPLYWDWSLANRRRCVVFVLTNHSSRPYNSQLRRYLTASSWASVPQNAVHFLWVGRVSLLFLSQTSVQQNNRESWGKSFTSRRVSAATRLAQRYGTVFKMIFFITKMFSFFSSK